MIGIFRTSIPGSSVAGVTSATVVQAAFFTALSVVIVVLTGIFRPHTVSKGSPADESGNFFANAELPPQQGPGKYQAFPSSQDSPRCVRSIQSIRSDRWVVAGS
jgi:hypothetical protein